MKKLFKLFTIGLLASATFSACSDKDACKDVICGDYGQCIDGSCLCNAGYEKGADGLCSVEERQKFLGSFTGTESCNNSATSTYTMTIIRGSGISQVRIANMWNKFVNGVLAEIDGDEITIGNQEPDNDGFTISGSGRIDGNTIKLTYVVTAPDGETDNCIDSQFIKL